MSEKEKKTRIWGFEDKITLIVIICTIAILFLFLFLVNAYVMDFITKFIAGLLGVFFAFTIDRHLERRNRELNKIKLLHDLKAELEYVNTQIYPANKSVLILYPDIYDSAIASGQIRLLDSEHIIKLTSVYRHIKGASYEASRVRDAIEEFNNTHPVQIDLKQWHERIYKNLWERHEKRMEELNNEITKLLTEKWWAC